MIIDKNLIWEDHNKLKAILEEKYASLIKEYENKEQQLSSIPGIIWVCWWQGMENAPEVVRLCYERLKQMAGDRKVNLITAENYKDYIEMPDYIIEKLEKKIISITHFSDALRVNLLSKYGGVWIDATCFLTGNVFEDMTSEFYTVKLPHNDNEPCVSDGKWCIFFMGTSPNNVLFNFLTDFYNIYWKEENSVIAYYLTDYMVDIAYDKIKCVKDMIDKVPENNLLIHTLKGKLNEEFDESEFERLCSSNKIHKLAHERNYVRELENGKETFYGHIYNQIRLN